MSENKLGYNQASKYLSAIAEVFYEVMETKKPADRELRSFFSSNKQCGSKDRRFISEGLYSLFRWYGCLSILIPQERPDDAINSEGFRKALLICLNLEGMTDSLAYDALCDLASYESIEFSQGLAEKMNQLGILLGKELSLEDLVPEWFLAVTKDLNPEFFESLQRRPPIWIRIQKNGLNQVLEELKTNDVEFEVSAKLSNAVKILSKVNLVAFKTFRKGLFEVQDLASQVLVSVCQVKSGQNWWDVCAGAGGKTLALADSLFPKGKVLATDKRKHVLQEVKKRSERAGFRNISLANLEKEKRSSAKYDGLLVDAPCSCTGTWRRNPDARWTREENVCHEWSSVQLQILNEVCLKVKEGGVLIYATCSSSFIENEQVVDEFLKANDAFELEPVRHPLSGEVTSGMLNVEALPDDCDSMFAARMIRKKK